MADVKADENPERLVTSAVEELAHVDPDPAFFDDHLKTCPNSVVETIEKRSDVRRWAADISKVTTKEGRLYQPVASLLTSISQAVFGELLTER
ncbi:hypothetical protein NUW54_g11690 [Trametes sanguinea]|uniref:Uncharacterized protein n=1 Tax=Trametes sanguinea TaxID=158606 RepID=A0ACC1N9S6_9APHY|nr:hypothetical protein NUW54_g11690 [Trametes sanguinea]